MSAKVKTGVVKWFNDVRGYGFIIADEPENGQDVLAHYSRIEGTGFRKLVEGQRVRFTEELTEKGRMATWIGPAVCTTYTYDVKTVTVELPMLGQAKLEAL